MQPGLHPDLSGTYHSAPPVEALTQSKIKILLDQTPFDLKYGVRAPSPEMEFGSIVHALALGKGMTFAVSPYDDYRTKDARAWRDQIIADGMTPLKQDKYDEAANVAEVALQRIMGVLRGFDYQTEVPFYWKEGETWCSGMLDVWCPDLLVALDLKVTGNLGSGAGAAMVRYGWDLQAAWYLRGLDVLMPEHAGRIRFANLLVRPDAPYTTRLTSINEAWRTSAETECWRALHIWDRCMESGVWPGYDTDVELLDAPSWIISQRMMAGASE